MRHITTDIPLTCLDCGACCEQVDGKVPFHPGERVPEWYRAEHEALPLRPGKACPWWTPGVTTDDGNAGECGHPKDRPNICEYERGCDLCLTARMQHVKAASRAVR